MKKLSLLLFSLLFGFALSPTAAAFIVAPSQGQTGWNTFEWTPDSAFTGTVGWVVSDWYDEEQPSYLLLDNLSHGPTGNAGFELGNLTGYTPDGVAYVASSFTNTIGNGQTSFPTEGSNMAVLDSDDDDTGVDTSGFGYGGTDGSTLELALGLDASETFSFDWNFATSETDYYLDFSLFYVIPESGAMETMELGQAPAAVPIPGAIWLLGSGLIGLIEWRRRFRE